MTSCYCNYHFNLSEFYLHLSELPTSIEFTISLFMQKMSCKSAFGRWIMVTLWLFYQGGPTSTKYVDRIGSYQWFLNDETATILVPGQPTESFFWPGGKLMQDHGVVIYDVNHMKVENSVQFKRFFSPILVFRWKMDLSTHSLSLPDCCRKRKRNPSISASIISSQTQSISRKSSLLRRL